MAENQKIESNEPEKKTDELVTEEQDNVAGGFGTGWIEITSFNPGGGKG